MFVETKNGVQPKIFGKMCKSQESPMNQVTWNRTKMKKKCLWYNCEFYQTNWASEGKIEREINRNKTICAFSGQIRTENVNNVSFLHGTSRFIGVRKGVQRSEVAFLAVWKSEDTWGQRAFILENKHNGVCGYNSSNTLWQWRKNEISSKNKFMMKLMSSKSVWAVENNRKNCTVMIKPK